MRRESQTLRFVLAHNVRRLRSQLGVSQEELADMCGLHRTYVGSVERCERNVTLSTIEVLAQGLGVSPDSLLREGNG
ncbi:MAG: helix-turn-helix transcriptional regulator [Armatimonadota bacterium]